MQWLRFELWLGWQLKPSRNLLGVLVMGLFNGRASKKILWSNPALKRDGLITGFLGMGYFNQGGFC